jgi:prevent-host-death family protein
VTIKARDAVGIQELRARLSELLERVRGGERLLVTVRGEPVAELIPHSPERQAPLVEKGRVGGGVKPKGLRGVVVRGEPVAETVLRDRR